MIHLKLAKLMPKGQWSQMPGQTFILHPPWVSSFGVPLYYGRPNHWERALIQYGRKMRRFFPLGGGGYLANGGVPGHESGRRATTTKDDVDDEVGRDGGG